MERTRLVKGILFWICAICGLGTFAWARTAGMHRVFVIGDSTVMTYQSNVYPQSGWGQELAFYFDPASISILNRAIGGRSSRSFVEDGHWASVKKELKSGDFLFIQFGHNDRSTVPERHADTAQYKTFLTQYISEARALGAIPVLVSPMNMNTWIGTSLREVFTEGVNDYRGAMSHVAAATGVPFIDLEKKSKELFQGLGQAYLTDFLFLTLMPKEYPNFPQGNTDGTHFREMGAVEMAGLVASGLRDLGSGGGGAETSALAGAMVPLADLKITGDKPGAALLTRSAAYPAGIPITLKVSPKAGETFLQWVDGAGKVLGKETHLTFPMPAAGRTVFAQFKGGSGSLVAIAAAGSPGGRTVPVGNRPVSQAYDAGGRLRRASTRGPAWTRPEPVRDLAAAGSYRKE